jgi:hypothetical protein
VRFLRVEQDRPNAMSGNLIQKRVMELLCVLVLVVVMAAGLWPFYVPPNDVRWLPGGNGLRFGKHGVVLSTRTLKFTGLKDGLSCSLEIWLQPATIDTGGTLLAFYSPLSRTSTFLVQQSLDDLLLQVTKTDREQPARTKWYITHALRAKQDVVVTVVSGTQSTAVYLNGVLAGSSGQFGLLSRQMVGQLVVGNRPLVENSWQGQLRGLAVFNRELSPKEVSQHYVDWTANRKDEIEKENPAALYLFNEGNGNVVHSQVNSANDLRIPDRYLVLDATFLETPWAEFDASWSYCKDILINIAGFLPLGIVFCAYFSRTRRLDRPVQATIVLGAVVSLTIEILQAFLPTRNSGMTDIITNTFGTAVGAVLYSRQWVRTLLPAIPGCKQT